MKTRFARSLLCLPILTPLGGGILAGLQDGEFFTRAVSAASLLLPEIEIAVSARFSTETEIAAKFVREAALLVRTIEQELVSGSLEKEDRSPVTVADFAAQALVACRMAEQLPGFRLVGEEDVQMLQEAENAAALDEIVRFLQTRVSTATAEQVIEWIGQGEAAAEGDFWTLDPIDGTKGFLRGDHYAVALGKVVGGVVQAGILGCPKVQVPGAEAPGALLVAERGQGTWAGSLGQDDDWRQVNVSDQFDVRQARMLRSVESAHTNRGAAADLSNELHIEAAPIGMDSQAKYAALAMGDAELLVRLISKSRPDYREKIWDQAAGSIIVEEAGGKVTDLDGKPLDFSHGRTLATNRGVLATNGPLHEPALAGLRAIGA